MCKKKKNYFLPNNEIHVFGDIDKTRFVGGPSSSDDINFKKFLRDFFIAHLLKHFACKYVRSQLRI